MLNKKKSFELVSKYSPAGDQIEAIKNLTKGVVDGKKNQVLLGVTGSGKTFTMANIIANLNRPALIMAHNKTLAAQLYSEFKNFFPNNAVEYFVSFFDYYQPEAYIASSDTYIDKDSQINSKIEQMKLSTIYSLLERRDTIVIASVSSIYGIGEKDYYTSVKLNISVNEHISIKELSLKLVSLQYQRNDTAFERATFRIKGDILEIYPAHFDDYAIKVSFFGDEIEKITLIDPLTNQKLQDMPNFSLYAATLFATPKELINKAIINIKHEVLEQEKYFKENKKLIEAQRIVERTNYDIEMLAATGYVKGIENYTRYLSSKPYGSTPSTLFDYLPDDALVFVDESHATVPQLTGMYAGDKARKSSLVEYGFRLPSCLDNRPLMFNEWDKARKTSIFVSATPAEWELNLVNNEVQEQLIRPTGLLDPICIVRPVVSQIDDITAEIKELKKKNERVIVITLTKKMAEQITDYFNENGVRAKYLHSDIDTLERVELIASLRRGEYDAIVGINLLREGLDIPECSLVAILDADKEGFLRSKTSLVQIIGRAARNSAGKVILYADKITNSLDYALKETARRRAKQEEYNTKHNITPTTVFSSITKIELENGKSTPTRHKGKGSSQKDSDFVYSLQFKTPKELQAMRVKIEKEMLKASDDLNFELAIALRDQLNKIFI
jgi:excinuclease ABC subunit B